MANKVSKEKNKKNLDLVTLKIIQFIKSKSMEALK